ncbi:scavenger mRNA decapping enzyme [Metschnikowia bicuspidata var. bicuspidata NRRL YB-4993]|uniref:m7GpppX diphosphatase n=1 Tax=Metschnikowia bicuspidata var. bicuspidata NRRL YB-4993 TaxID=869754 RepID=A0A1A0HIK3_9ASCO|nr:scavenger mRNA decapping enzyme [Metschnikowia bicuspidata var. bicuspidata NRRL YB-4993]OBA23717.1 scavenger mRNA decapping enzyme [Metschnikowia bicuspidata var. bicuspidata NRRL YB-4993]
MKVEELAAKFTPTEVLKTDTQTKSVVILGTVDGENAICSLEKTAFSISEVGDALLSKLVDGIQLINDNDVYLWSMAALVQDLEKSPGAKVNFIHPASETHIRKYRSQAHHWVAETPEVYRKIVRPFIDTQKGDRIQWVYNILFKGKESETFIHHDTDPQDGYVLLPDMKWDRSTLEALYLVTIVNRTDISSVRDIDGSHVDFLMRVRDNIKQVVSEKYLVAEDQLRLFVHYQPSYYHFHIHVVNINHPGLGAGINAGKAILLDDVIDNVRMVYDYYQRRTMYYQLGGNHKLWEKLEELKELCC